MGPIRLCVYAAVLAALLYPLLSSVLWDSATFHVMCTRWFGLILIISVGLYSGVMLPLMQRLFRLVPSIVRSAFIRFIGASAGWRAFRHPDPRHGMDRVRNLGNAEL